MLFLIGWKRALSYFKVLIFKMCTVLKRNHLVQVAFFMKVKNKKSYVGFEHMTWRSNADGFILALSCYIRMYRKRIKYIDYLNLLLIWKDETSQKWRRYSKREKSGMDWQFLTLCFLDCVILTPSTDTLRHTFLFLTPFNLKSYLKTNIDEIIERISYL